MRQEVLAKTIRKNEEWTILDRWHKDERYRKGQAEEHDWTIECVKYLDYLATIDVSYTAPNYQRNRDECMAHLKSNGSNLHQCKGWPQKDWQDQGWWESKANTNGKESDPFFSETETNRVHFFSVVQFVSVSTVTADLVQTSFFSEFRVQVVATAMHATGEVYTEHLTRRTACVHLSRARIHLHTHFDVCHSRLDRVLRILNSAKKKSFHHSKSCHSWAFLTTPFQFFCSSPPISSLTSTTPPTGIRSITAAAPLIGEFGQMATGPQTHFSEDKTQKVLQMMKVPSCSSIFPNSSFLREIPSHPRSFFSS